MNARFSSMAPRWLALAVFSLAPASAWALEAAVPPVLEVYPESIDLKQARDRQGIVVRLTEANGVNRNVTAEAKLSAGDPAMVRVENGVVYPVADGETVLNVEWQGQKKSVPVKVSEAKTEPAVSFRLDVMPVFMKGECNRCHGAARGQDGFRLSLWGFDPEGDHYRITREFPGRRINLATPEASLMLTKADGSAPHTGGKRLMKGTEMHDTMLRWLQAGAPNDPPTVPTCTSLEILPNKLVLESPGQKFRISVRAKYSDGSDRDVTSTALFLTNNEAAAKIADDGTITTGQRGEAFVMARFATHTVGAQVIVIPKGLKFEWPKVEDRNFVDELVSSKLRNLRITPSGGCDDETYLRRVYIDIIGLLPTPEETSKFVADKNPAKRTQVVDTLLQRPEFVDLWALKFSDLLQIRTPANNNIGSYKATLSYYNWLHEQLEKNVPINEVARQLIGSSGSNLENPAVNYYQLEQDPMKLAEDTAQSFFGIRIQCAQCHNHPFDRWTMEDYRGFVAFFTQTGRKNGEDPREKIVFNRGAGESLHPVGNKVVPPKFLGGAPVDATGKDRRQLLADWIASPENPYFPQHMGNLIWAQYMGRGIVEPVDDARISNPASNPELLAALGRKLVEYGYDLRRIVRDICTSRTYQLTAQTNSTNELDDRNFAHATIRRMRAEVMLDCISEVTETKDKFRGMPAGARAVQIADARTTNYFLATFGRASRENICSREEVGPTLSQALHLINGDTVEQKIALGGVIKKLVKENRTPVEITQELYLRCFGRQPTDKEMLALQPLWEVTEQQPAVLHDVFWALLNAKEFMFNH